MNQPSQAPANSPLGSPMRSDTLFSEQVPPALKSLIDRYGTPLLGDAGRLRGLLQDEVPQAKKEISVLLLALEERVPQDLMRVHSGEPIASLSPRLARRLSEEKSLSTDAARWAVYAWARGLGLDSVLPPMETVPGPAFGGQASPPVPPHSAANERFGDVGSLALPQPSPLQDKRVQIGLGALAAIGIAAAGWWFTQPQLDITRIDTAGVFVGNGKPQPVFVDFQSRNTQVKSAEVRLVKGDGDWGQTSWKIDVTPDAANAGRVTAGSLQVKASKPMTATFEYTLVAADGKRSAPFQRTFDVVAPLLITRVNVPRPLRVGREFAVDIGFQKSGAEIVRVERKVIESTVPWQANELAQPLKLNTETGRFDYKFDAFAKPTRATVEFTLVDAAGLRSEPVRVALDIAAPAPAVAGTGPGTVTAINAVRGANAQNSGQSSGVGAVLGGILGGILGNQVGGGKGRVVTTVGGVAGGAWAGNEVEKRMGNGAVAATAAEFETTVRFDDGQTRVIRTPGNPRWQVGSRVVWDGRVLSPGTR